MGHDFHGELLNNQRVFHRELQVLFGWILRYFISGQTQILMEIRLAFPKVFLSFCQQICWWPQLILIFFGSLAKNQRTSRNCVFVPSSNHLCCVGNLNLTTKKPWFLAGCTRSSSLSSSWDIPRKDHGRMTPPIEPRGLNITGWSVGLWCAWLLGDNP